jgi:hypothetical protein
VKRSKFGRAIGDAAKIIRSMRFRSLAVDFGVSRICLHGALCLFPVARHLLKRDAADQNISNEAA